MDVYFLNICCALSEKHFSLFNYFVLNVRIILGTTHLDFYETFIYIDLF